MAKAIKDLTATPTTGNPIEALAALWREILSKDGEDEAASRSRACLELAVLQLEPENADQALAIALVSADELEGQEHIRTALEAVSRWLVRGGAVNPLARAYARRGG